MASNIGTRAGRCLTPLLRRSVVARRGTNSMMRGGGHHEPPLPPFARIPPPTEKLVENNDAVWDDGVAPELALDFDLPHMSTNEAMLTWLTGMAGFVALFYTIKLVKDPDTENPALPHSTAVVDIDHGQVGVARPTN